MVFPAPASLAIDPSAKVFRWISDTSSQAHKPRTPVEIPPALKGFNSQAGQRFNLGFRERDFLVTHRLLLGLRLSDQDYLAPT
jgi:hypothetical protein